MASCDLLMQVFLILFNLIIVVIGAVALGLGIWVKVDKKHLFDLTKDVTGTDLNSSDIPSLLENAVLVLMISGAIIFLIGFLGFGGAAKHKTKAGKIFLKIYAVIVLVILIVEVAGVAIAWVFFDSLETNLKNYLDSSLSGVYQANFSVNSDDSISYTSNGDPITLAWDIAQVEFSCCGRRNGSDFSTMNNLTWDGYRTVTLSSGLKKEMIIPPTCCKMSDAVSDTLEENLKKGSFISVDLLDQNCPFDPTSDNSYIEEGCYETIKSDIKDNSVIFIAIGGSTLFIELVCIMFSCCLARTEKDKSDEL